MPTIIQQTQTATIKNPVLRGFNPDPSILRVREDYFIATSTFEWFPGVQVHHSRDLLNWQLTGRPLDRPSQLDMVGNPDSGGVWAPCLSHCDGLFHLVYSNVRKWKQNPYKIVDNFLVTAPSIDGPWSDPLYLNSSGFDPSLFHDDDGRKWLVSMEWDFRKSAAGRLQFTGILLQEFDPRLMRLVGRARKIFDGTDIGLVEGPHLYRKNGYYYLLTAEGGTEYNHAVTLARSRDIGGPYEVHPQNPLLTSSGNPGLVLQKAGHGSLVETPKGEWYLAHLCGRPVDGRHCILGRETALQKCLWKDDDWLYLADEGASPQVEVPAPGASAPVEPARAAWNGEFTGKTLDIHFQSLRQPVTEGWLSLTDRPGWLRLRGQEPTVSTFRQSLIARRVQDFHVEALTEMDFHPFDFHQMAGLIAYYDTENHYYLRVSHANTIGRNLNIISTVAGASAEALDGDIPLPHDGTLHLKLSINHTALQFAWSPDGRNWEDVGPVLDSTILSDDFNHLGFTGAFVGLCAQDLVRSGIPADFRFFRYRELS